jgi:hypothetical protein
VTFVAFSAGGLFRNDIAADLAAIPLTNLPDWDAI